MQTSALIFAAALVGMTSAQTTTTSLFLIGFDNQSILGSVVGSDATATTYALNCGSQDETECGLPPSFTFTQGPSTVHYAYTIQGEDGEGQETLEMGCEITSSDHGVCSQSMNGLIGTVSTSTSATESFSNGGEVLGLQAVTITAGAVAGSPNTVSQTSSSASGSGSSSSTSTSATGKASSTSGASETSRTAAAATSSSSTGGGGAMITKAPWIVGGAAAVLGYAAM